VCLPTFCLLLIAYTVNSDNFAVSRPKPACPSVSDVYGGTYPTRAAKETMGIVSIRPTFVDLKNATDECCKGEYKGWSFII
jgi:hypothetical protein